MNSRICVVIPTFNNAATLPAVLDGVLHHVDDVIVVDDGSTDATPQLLAERSGRLDVVTLSHNQGKGAALVAGFRRAMDRGFSHAVTLDSDSQHRPDDLPAFLTAIRRHPAAIIVGNRFAPSHFTEENAANMNTRSKFANRLSNFWFRVQTGEALPDTQTGFRAYPLHRLHGLRWLTSRYEAELELLVFAAWHDVRFHVLPVRVYYPPREERVSHFRPTADFARITLLNTALTTAAFAAVWPWRCLKVLAGFAVLFLLLIVMLVVQVGLFLFFQSHRVSEQERLAYHRCIQRVSRRLLRLLPGVSHSVLNPRGETFERPAVVISNHQSHLDLLCIMLLTPRLVILTKRWVWFNPLYALAIRYAEFLPTTHNVEQNARRLQGVVARGYSVMIFPEGTRSADCEILRFHQGAFHLAQRLGLPILPIFLHGTGLVLGKRDQRLRSGHITIEVGERLSIDQGRWGTTPLAIAKSIRHLYIEHYEEMRRHW